MALGKQILREKVVRLPGAVVTVDDGRLESGLMPHDRVLLAPAGGLDAYGRGTAEALRLWSSNAKLRLTVIEGLWVARFHNRERELLLDEANETTRRRVIGFNDATDLLLGARAPKLPPPARASEAQLDQLTVADQPGVRVATAPAASEFVDYASGLARRHPGELVAVAHGGWLEFAGPGHDRAKLLRDHVHTELLRSRGTVDLVDAVLKRVLVSPRPTLDPPEAPNRRDWSVTVSQFIPLVAGGAGLIGWLLFRFARRLRAGATETRAMRLARAEAFTRIEELGTRLLDAETTDSHADERHGTARTLFERAQTAEAMTEVTRIADEGLQLLGGQS